LATERVERRLTAILAADVAGCSRLMAADEEGTLVRLKAHRRVLVDSKIIEHGGRTVKTTGDGMLVEFASVVDAPCAVLSRSRAAWQSATPKCPVTDGSSCAWVHYSADRHPDTSTPGRSS
jgi:class 3 adenylate cyclase